MQFAALETSTEWCSVAVWRDGEIAALERRAGHRHSELVLPMLESLLGKTKLDAVAFGAGPGAFTGLRIACGLTVVTKTSAPAIRSSNICRSSSRFVARVTWRH